MAIWWIDFFQRTTGYPSEVLVHVKSYYVDTSVLLENIPLVKFIKTTSRTRVVFSIISHVSLSMT